MADLVRRGRVGAFVVGALGFSVILGVRVAPEDWTVGDSGDRTFALMMAGWFVSLVALPLLYQIAFWRACRPPRPGFLIGRYAGGPAFASPVTPLVTGPTFVLQVTLFGLGVPVGTVWPEAASQVTKLVAGTVAAAGTVLLVVVAVLVLFRPPRLRLTPDGLVVATAFRRRRILWDALAPGGPTTHEAGRGVLWLQARPGTPGLGLEWPANVHRRPPLPGYAWYQVMLTDVLVDTVFLAHALRTYRDHPHLRTEIGTPEGLQRLHETLRPSPLATASQP